MNDNKIYLIVDSLTKKFYDGARLCQIVDTFKEAAIYRSEKNVKDAKKEIIKNWIRKEFRICDGCCEDSKSVKRNVGIRAVLPDWGVTVITADVTYTI
jgi:hypothetical protein